MRVIPASARADRRRPRGLQQVDRLDDRVDLDLFFVDQQAPERLPGLHGFAAAGFAHQHVERPFFEFFRFLFAFALGEAFVSSRSMLLPLTSWITEPVTDTGVLPGSPGFRT